MAICNGNTATVSISGYSPLRSKLQSIHGSGSRTGSRQNNLVVTGRGGSGLNSYDTEDLKG